MLDLIYFVPQGQQGMVHHHPWPGKSHDAAHPVPHVGLVAMDRAVGAGRFFGLKGALFYPLHGIGEQGLTFCAQGPPGPVMSAAVNPDHRPDRLSFSC